jgi:hypothetical protein
MYRAKHMSGCGCQALGDAGSPDTYAAGGIDPRAQDALPPGYNSSTTVSSSYAAQTTQAAAKVNGGAVPPSVPSANAPSGLQAFFDRPIGNTGFTVGQASAAVSGLTLLVALLSRR